MGASDGSMVPSSFMITLGRASEGAAVFTKNADASKTAMIERVISCFSRVFGLGIFFFTSTSTFPERCFVQPVAGLERGFSCYFEVEAAFLGAHLDAPQAEDTV